MSRVKVRRGIAFDERGVVRLWVVVCPCGSGAAFTKHAEAVAMAHQMGLTHALEAAFTADCE